MQYDVLWETNIHDLIKMVNDKIKEGWEPLGGILRTDQAFYQAMIKK